jgi:hypothetical protein
VNRLEIFFSEAADRFKTFTALSLKMLIYFYFKYGISIYTYLMGVETCLGLW